MSNPVTNIHWFEYLEKKEEELRYIEQDLESKQITLKWIESEVGGSDETADLNQRIILLLSECKRLRAGVIIGIDNNAQVPIAHEIYKQIKLKIDYLIRSNAVLSSAINQRLEGITLLDCSPFLIESSLSGFQKTHRAANFLLEEYFKLVYGESWLKSSNEPKPIVVFGEGGYSVIPDLRLANIPFADKFRYRFWIGLGHETFHEKIRQFFYTLPLAADGDKRALVSLQQILSEDITLEECQEILKFYAEFIKALEKFYGINEDFPGSLRVHIQNIIDEFFCDFASLLLTGPSVLIMLASFWADTYKHLPFGFSHHMDDLQHPPEYVRLKCMLDVLQSDVLNYPKEYVQTFESRIEQIKGFDSIYSVDEKGIKTNDEIVLWYARYFALIKKRMTPILEITKMLISEKHFYDEKKWRETEKLYKKIMASHSIPKGTAAIDLLNVAWIKREKVFESVKNNNSINIFKEIHLRERKLFEEVMLYLGKRQLDKTGD